MFGRKQSPQKSVKNGKGNAPSVYDEALNWEAAHVRLVEKSERRAWKIAGAFGTITVLLGIGIAGMLPLKQHVPYLVRVNAQTGAPDILTSLDEKSVSYDTVMDKYWLSQYVIARETYDWYTLQKDYETVGMLSSPSEGQSYASQFQGDKALDKQYGSNVRTSVTIVSIVPNGKGIGTVRFAKTTKRTNETGDGETTHWIATIGYQYVNPSLMSESARLTNPLGFNVTSYRVDPEMGVVQ